MVKIILVVEEKGKTVRKTGRVRSCEANHVVLIDEIGNTQYIAYAHIAHIGQALDSDHWSREPK